ncbi:hypothetical protein N7494_002331 [Penicillium frequentans]|uniref:Uncharacterized protein n=1 Tax=Penicillium frequentans TaxID=3151616 RepID=A0AAD6D5H1_9EURO|nr:hypothetical protein N7494_002331 [Penicillium glabrum]
MAIFDSEKRPRGLRVPSLTAMKNGSAAARSQFSFKKSNEVKTPEEPVVIPVAVPALPPQQAPPTKELPPPPKDQVPPPPRMLTKVPPRRKVANAPNGIPSPVAQTPVTAPAPAPVPVPVQAQAPQSPPLQPSPQTASPKHKSTLRRHCQLLRKRLDRQNIPPVTLSPPPSDENEALTPLEDFIPTPEGPGTPLDNLSTEELSMPPMLDIEPVAAPLNKVHFACFQEHRNMPVAQNVWCPLPCQTCHKFNREIRHRCVFCCLRVCEGCYQALLKCKNRSLSELMQKL